jgi:hypothetical protein
MDLRRYFIGTYQACFIDKADEEEINVQIMERSHYFLLLKPFG